MSLLTAFFSNTKLILGAVGSFVVTIFFLVFKARGREIKEQQEEIEELEREKKFNKVLSDVNDKIKDGYIKEDKEIEEHYEAKQEELYKEYDQPLSDSFLSKLRNAQGVSDADTKSPE